MKYSSETVHNHLLRMPTGKWADCGKVTSGHKLASPEINWDRGTHNIYHDNHDC